MRPTGWITDTLKEHVEAEIRSVRCQIHDADRRYEQRFAGQDDAVAAALVAAEKAVLKAETATEKRFDAVNEFRGQLSDQAALFIDRREFSAAHSSLVDKIDELNARINRSEGSMTGSAVTKANLIAAAVVIISAFGVIVTLTNGRF